MLESLAKELLHRDAVEQDHKSFVNNVVSANKLDDNLHVASCNATSCGDTSDLKSVLQSIQLTEDLPSEEKAKLIYERCKNIKGGM